MEERKTAYPLDGIKVVETAQVAAGPMAGRLLTDWGADVIHIEHPERGDILRASRAAGLRVGKTIISDINFEAETFNRNKRSVTLDLSREGGRGILYRLLEKADVLISNFRPRELKKFNMGYETLSQLNPGLIFANITGYGRKGPDRDLPGYDTTSYFARTGILHLLQVPGTVPPFPPMAMGDNVAGLALAFGILLALLMRDKTGMGQEVDVSLFQAGLFALSADVAGSLVTGQDRRQSERKDLNNPLNTVYQTKDGRWLMLSVTQPDAYWSRFCQAIDREDIEHDPRFELFEPRIENHAALFPIVEEVFLGKTLDEWKVRLNEAGLPWGPIQNLPEVTADPQARANDFFVAYDHPTHGHIEVVANPVKLGQVKARVTRPAPEFGQHTEEVLLEHGYTWADIAQFKEQGLIA